uniref:Antimicrobial peptide FM-CATH2 n=1 Tax=Fejervarya multistriata TaxID=429310 RepID=A0A2H4FVA4_FEJMU|nr:antimicrobial peptide FM-CATH2 precursor [Fejervarya multistriata]
MKVWQCVLWICAITLHSARSQSSDQDGWIREALDLYNQKDDGEFCFKFLSDLPDALLEEEGDSQSIGFLIKETDCLKSEGQDLEQCDYKEDGEVKACVLSAEEEVKCVSLSEKRRTRRAIKKLKTKALNKLKQKLQAVGNLIGSVIKG